MLANFMTSTKGARARPVPRTQSVQSFPAPTLGINALDPISMQTDRDALVLDNMVSTGLGTEVRGGWREQATNLQSGLAAVVSVMPYQGAGPDALVDPFAYSKIFAATDLYLYDVTAGGSFAGVAPTVNLSGAAGAGRFSYAQFRNSGGNFLVACSETDGAFIYYPAVGWRKFATTGGPGPGIVTGAGLDPAMFVYVLLWKRRLLFVERGSGRMWFLPVEQVGGAMQVFDFGPILSKGGFLNSLASWTQDAGDGIDDRLIVIGSQGDLAVYEGTDPSNPDAFSKAGTWYVGRMPAGRRCVSDFGGSPYIFSQAGLIPVSMLMQGGLDNILSSTAQQVVQLRKLQPVLDAALLTTIDTPGWEIKYLLREKLMLISRPQLSTNRFVQYAFQSNTNAWNTFSGMPATCFEVINGETYFGTADGRVCKAFIGGTDDVKLDGSGGDAIVSQVQCAFNYFGAHGAYKQFLMVRPTILAETPPSIRVQMNPDFKAAGSPSVPSYLPTEVSRWDAAIWGTGIWSGSLNTFQAWLGVTGFGYAGSFVATFASTGRLVLTAIDYMNAPGGVL